MSASSFLLAAARANRDQNMTDRILSNYEMRRLYEGALEMVALQRQLGQPIDGIPDDLRHDSQGGELRAT